MANVLDNSQRLAEIQSQLPYGAQSEIARGLGVTRTAVNQNLTGVRNNPEIQKAIFLYYLDWVAKQPAPLPPVDTDALDQALVARRAQLAGK